MLRINLLPQEYRAPEGVSLGMLAMLVGCTLLSVSSICVAAFLYFSVLRDAESRRNIAMEEYENLAPMAKYADDLEAEKRDYMKRDEAIKRIESTRILWTRKIDQLCRVVNDKGHKDRHWAWLKELKMKMGEDVRDAGIELKGYVAGDQYDHLSNFNEDLKDSPLFDGFRSISNPTGSITYEKERIPHEAIEFDWKLMLETKDSKGVKRPVRSKPPVTGKKQ